MPDFNMESMSCWRKLGGENSTSRFASEWSSSKLLLRPSLLTSCSIITLLCIPACRSVLSHLVATTFSSLLIHLSKPSLMTANPQAAHGAARARRLRATLYVCDGHVKAYENMSLISLRHRSQLTCHPHNWLELTCPDPAIEEFRS